METRQQDGGDPKEADAWYKHTRARGLQQELRRMGRAGLGRVEGLAVEVGP